MEAPAALSQNIFIVQALECHFEEVGSIYSENFQ